MESVFDPKLLHNLLCDFRKLNFSKAHFFPSLKWGSQYLTKLLQGLNDI